MPAPNRTWSVRLASAIPEWMQNRPGLQVFYKFLWSWTRFLDIATQAALEGVRAGWPGYDSRTDNLALLGASRGLIQGETETAASFQARLRAWLTLSTLLGGSVGLSLSVHFYLSSLPMVRIWTRNGRCTTCCAGSFTLTAGSVAVTASASQTGILQAGDTVYFQPGPLTPYKVATLAGTAITLTTPWAGETISTGACATQIAKVAGGWSGPGPLSGYGLNWDSVSNPERATWWWENWMVVYTSEFGAAGNLAARATGQNSPNAEQAATGQQYGIGHLCTRTQVDAIRGLQRYWKGQHATIRWTIWTSNAALFDPRNLGQAGNPDGTWGSWSFFKTIGGVASKYCTLNTASCRFWSAIN